MIYSVESSHEKESMLQIKYNIMSHYVEAFLNNRKQRVRIKGIFSNWVPVGSGIPQSSLLGPTLFIIYINDLVEHVNYGSDLYLYADDAKLFSFIKTMEHSAMLQKDLDSLTQWMETWLLRLNIGQCKARSYSWRPELNTNYNISGVTGENIKNIKDLGVNFDNKLKFDKHINNKINTACQMLGIVKRNFIYLTPDSFVVLYKTI